MSSPMPSSTPVCPASAPREAAKAFAAFQTTLPGFSSPSKATPETTQESSEATPEAGKSHPQDTLACEIGREHARYGLVPPLPHLMPGHPVREGWQAGRRALAGRRLPPTPALQLALKLRLQAWTSGRDFETLEVTPRYLAQLDAAHCPVTREPLSGTLDMKGEVVGLNRRAGLAAGHLVLLGCRAAHALAALNPPAEQGDWQAAAQCAAFAAEVRGQASRADIGRTAALSAAKEGSGLQNTPLHRRLNADEWARLATLLSFVTPLPHEQAARLPLRALPPARVRVLNPIQGLQALISLQLLHADWRPRMARLAAQVGRTNPGALQHFHIVFHTLLARALEGGDAADTQALRERLEDAWAQPHLLRRWQTFALAMSPAQAATLERQAALIGQHKIRVRHHSSASVAMEGWGQAA